MLEQLEEAILEWLQSRKTDRMLRRYGTINTCPWCRQIAQSKDGWKLEPNFHPDTKYAETNDILTCGVCGGTSMWRFEFGSMYIGPVDPPKPKS